MNADHIDHLGKLIAAKRELLGLSATEVARRAGLTASTVTRIEQSQVAAPNVERVQAIGEVLDIPASDLFAAAGWMPKRELPTIEPYLRTKYDELPPEAITQIEAYFASVAEEYGVSFDRRRGGPAHGEDE